MELTWIVPVTFVAAATTYAVLGRYFAHKERLAQFQHESCKENADAQDN